MTAIRQRPETLVQGVLLAATGGFLDAFTFVRYGVFANAQSGNVVLFGVDAASRHWQQAALRLAPVLAFAVGVVLVETLGRLRRRLAHPVRLAVAMEVVGLAVVAVLPDPTPQLAVTLSVSFVAAIQFTTFRTLVDTTYTTLMTSGNLRSLISAAHHWVVDRDTASRDRAARLGQVVLAFALGAVLGAVVTRCLGNPAVAVPAGLLLLTLVSLVRETRRLARRSADDAPAGPG